MKKWIFQLLPLDGRYFLSTVALKQYSPPSYTVEVACRGNIILRQIKQRNTNLLAREFAWFDHKFRPRLRRPYFNSFARDTQSILALAGMSSAYLISGSIPGTNPEVSRVSHMTRAARSIFVHAPGILNFHKLDSSNNKALVLTHFLAHLRCAH